MQELWNITHQCTALQWPKYNDMAQKLVKTLKHGLIILVVNVEHAQDWDEHLPHILFGYKFVV
jgi:hypothetical protein